MFRIMTLGAVCALLTSCSIDPAQPHPVSGKVSYRNKPAEGAIVTLVSADSKGPRPTAMVEPDGSFRLSTQMSYDGAPIGKYAVTIVYPSPEKKVEEQNAGPDLLRGKYSHPRKTPLHVEIVAGTNELKPFHLK